VIQAKLALAHGVIFEAFKDVTEEGNQSQTRQTHASSSTIAGTGDITSFARAHVGGSTMALRKTALLERVAGH
jgi:hypothetical protein